MNLDVLNALRQIADNGCDLPLSDILLAADRARAGNDIPVEEFIERLHAAAHRYQGARQTAAIPVSQNPDSGRNTSVHSVRSMTSAG